MKKGRKKKNERRHTEASDGEGNEDFAVEALDEDGMRNAANGKENQGDDGRCETWYVLVKGIEGCIVCCSGLKQHDRKSDFDRKRRQKGRGDDRRIGSNMYWEAMFALYYLPLKQSLLFPIHPRCK